MALNMAGLSGIVKSRKQKLVDSREVKANGPKGPDAKPRI